MTINPLTHLLTRAHLLPFPWTLGWPLTTLFQRKSGTQLTPPSSHPFQCARDVSEATVDQKGIITSTSSHGPIDAYHMEQESHPARPCPTSSPTKLWPHIKWTRVQSLRFGIDCQAATDHWAHLSLFHCLVSHNNKAMPCMAWPKTSGNWDLLYKDTHHEKSIPPTLMPTNHGETGLRNECK